MMKATKTWVLIILLFISAINVHAWPIPDTGQTKCYNNTVEITCPTPGQPFYGQDGSYTVNPPSYTKLDATGAALPNSATSWAMVRDNVTGLIWEKKTDDGGIHDRDNKYTWCDTNPATNGGKQGVCSSGTGNAATDTEAFIKALNDSNFGGFSDWRMPTPRELLSIVDFSRVNPAVDTTFFPGTMSNYYWSSTSVPLNSISAWVVNFGEGSIRALFGGFKLSLDGAYVQAVRAGQSVSMNYLVYNGDGTVTDTSTGLMWQQGTLYSKLQWGEALIYAEGFSLAEYDDWRMPTERELLSIVDFSRVNPAVDTTFFSGTMPDYYWSSTTNFLIPDAALSVNYYCGDMSVPDFSKDNTATTNVYYMRTVRAGQSRLSGHLIISAPGQADRWYIGEQKTITWDTAGIAGNVKISLSRHGGKSDTFETIIDSTENDGTYNWAVTGPVSVNCVLKIEPLNDLSKATSQGLFSISVRNPQITPSFLNFGYVKPEEYKDLILQVKNVGTGTLTGTVSTSPPFSIVSGGSYSLGANQTQQVTVRYTAPLEEGVHAGLLNFTGGDILTVQVTGTNKKSGGLPWLMLLLGN